LLAGACRPAEKAVPALHAERDTIADTVVVRTVSGST